MKTAFSAALINQCHHLAGKHLSHSRQNVTDSPSTVIVRNFSSESFIKLSCLFWSDFILFICNRRRSRASPTRWIVPSTVSTAVLACHGENLTNQRVQRSFLFASLFLFHLSSNQISIDFHYIMEKSSSFKIFLSSIEFLLYTCIQTKIILTPKKIQQKNKKSIVETKYKKIKYKKQANSRQATFFIFFTFIFFICFFCK